MTMTRVVFMGTPEFAVPSLAALLSAGYDVVGVLTREDQPAGRGQRVEESPVKKLARANGLPVQQPRTLRAEETQAALAALSPDLIVVAAYGLLLPQAVLDLPPHGCINVHGSLLPRYRGAAPITAAILAGESEAGISLMRMDAGLDTGPVIATAALPIWPNDTTGTLTGRMADLGAELLIETLPLWLVGEIPPQPQDDAASSFAPRLSKETGQVDWTAPAAVIERAVRAYQPWPSAYTTWRGLRLKIMRAHVDETEAPADTEPGLVISAVGRAGVVTGQGVLWLDEVQLAGKRLLPTEVFLRGAVGFVSSKLPS
jgi:methionyl-tRNA formyltransferase